VIQRCEQPREIVGLGVGRRRGRDQPDAPGGRRDGGEQGDRLEPEALGIADIVRQRRTVGEEDRFELVRLGALRELLIVGDVEDAIRRRGLVTPGRLVMTVRIDEEIEGKLPSAHGWLANVECQHRLGASELYVDDRKGVDEMNLRCCAGREHEPCELVVDRRRVHSF